MTTRARAGRRPTAAGLTLVVEGLLERVGTRLGVLPVLPQDLSFDLTAAEVYAALDGRRGRVGD